MATTAYVGPGFLLKVSDAGLSSMTTMAQCMDINGPGIDANMVEVTNQDSANGEAEFKPAVIKNGPITVTVVFDPANVTQNAAAGVIYLARQRARRRFQAFANPPTNSLKWDVYGYVSKITPKSPFNGMQTMDVELTVDGPSVGPS